MKKAVRPTLVIVLVLSLALLVSGCQTMSAQQRSALGTTLGSVAGAIAGSQFGDGNGRLVATALGAVVGGLAGNQFAAYLNEREQQSLARSTRQALLSDENRSGTVAWQSDERQGVAGKIYYGQAVAANDAGAESTLAQARGEALSAEERFKLAQLQGTNCRATRTSLSVEDRGVANGEIWCRTAEGDYKPLDMMVA